MLHNYYIYSFLFTLLLLHYSSAAFTPDTTDYDAYGPKIAMNDHLLVLAQNNHQPPSFFIQFPPYNHTLSSSSSSSSQCSIPYPNTTNTFIYSVAIGRKQNESELHFFFLGEHTNDQSGIFIGMATYHNTNQISNLTSTLCTTTFSYSFQYLDDDNNNDDDDDDDDHQEYFILAAHPRGVHAYGFSNRFIVLFDVENGSSSLRTWNGNMTWFDASFIPHAIDMNDDFGVVAGFIQNNANATVKYSPMIYLIRFNTTTTTTNTSEYHHHHHPYVINQYQPIATPNTWQDLLTNADANVYLAKYDMSVSIDGQGNVLVGMQFINRVFLFFVNITNPVRLNYISRYTNGRSLGNGKSVTWLDNGIGAVLINVYSLDYVWSSSQIFLFDIYVDGYNSTTTPLSIFPNSHQSLPSSFSPIFLHLISSPSSLALLDNKGNIVIFTPTQPQFYAFVVDTGSSPYTTSPKLCMPGSFKNKIGVHDCVLCPSGTKNPGNASNQCISCMSESFCPLGSVADISKSALESVFQVIPYPQSPESTIFDEILIHNMFSIGSGRCLLVSPLFWALIVASISVVIIVIMEILHLCVKHPHSRRVRKTLQDVFTHTDLIGEGEYWISGLVSFSVIVLVGFAYAFSNEYLKRYPMEKVSDAYFACDTSLKNAKFETNVQSLAIPFIEDEQEMFDLLNNQEFILNIDIINTMINCDVISIEAQFGLTWSTIRWLDCNNIDSILTLSIPLPYQHISVQVFLADTKTMGGIRIGFSGDGHDNERYTLKKLDFRQAYGKIGYVLSQTLSVAIAMTKIINETKPMESEESDFSGIYIPTFTVDMNSLFVSNDQYVRSSTTLTTLTIVISETPYYVKNVQEPIVRQSEVIFRNLLFTIVCLELFGLVFLSYKLAFKPIYSAIIRNNLKHPAHRTDNGEQPKSGA